MSKREISAWIIMFTIAGALIVFAVIGINDNHDSDYLQEFRNARVACLATKNVHSGKAHRTEYYVVLEGKDYSHIVARIQHNTYDNLTEGELLQRVVLDVRRHELCSIERDDML